MSDKTTLLTSGVAEDAGAGSGSDRKRGSGSRKMPVNRSLKGLRSDWTRHQSPGWQEETATLRPSSIGEQHAQFLGLVIAPAVGDTPFASASGQAEVHVLVHRHQPLAETPQAWLNRGGMPNELQENQLMPVLSSSVRRSRFASERGRFAGQARNCHRSLVRSQAARKA